MPRLRYIVFPLAVFLAALAGLTFAEAGSHTVTDSFSPSVDGLVGRRVPDVTYANLHDGAGTVESETSSVITPRVMAGISPDWNIIERAIVLFDVSAIPAGAKVMGATLTQEAQAVPFQQVAGQSVVVVESNPASDTNLVPGDYGTFVFVALSDSEALADIEADTPWVHTFNVWGRKALEDAIDGDGIARLGYMLVSDLDNEEPTHPGGDNQDTFIQIRSNENPTGPAPLLTIEYKP